MKFSFKRIENALQHIENETSYFIGRTLCIDFKDHPCVLLNLNGKGQMYHPDKQINRRSILVTKEMQSSINNIYLKYKKNKA